MIETRASRFYLREDHQGFPAALLRSMFEHADFGIVLTESGRQVLAANSTFGELFSVPADQVVEAGDIQTLRNQLQDRFSDPESFLSALDEIYSSPDKVLEVDVQLRNPSRVLQFHTRPVSGEEGERLGRLWTFRDVTVERRLETMRETLYRVSVFNDPDPWKVCSFIAEALGNFYSAHGIVTVLRDEFLEFRCLGGPPGPLSDLVGTTLDQSCCRIPIEALKPTLIADAEDDLRTCESVIVRMGIRAYMGFPLTSAQGTVRGTLSLMGGLRETPLDDEDLRFLSLLGMRVANELERARNVDTQLAAHRSVVEDQAADLAATREVLDAMVHAFDLVSFDESIETVLVAQAALLENLLGFGTVAILATGSAMAQSVLATPYEHRSVASPEAMTDIRRTVWLRRDALRQLGLEGFAEGLAVPLGSERRRFGFLIYEAERRIDLDEHRRIHLEAIAEQVALTLEAYTLRSELVEAGKEATARESEAVLASRLSTAGLLGATVAHDVKNIVAAISLELASNVEPARTLAAVRTHLDRFAILSHRLLSYSKPRMVVKRPVDLDEILRRVTGLFADHLRISDIQLVLSPAKMPIAVLSDPHQIEHLFANLLLNSIQAMSAKSGGLIEIKVKRSGRKAVVEVRDTGPGVKEENLDKMFEPFVGFRHEGFGLGLFAARRIANEHGGDVKVASTIGVGTSFTVTLQAAPFEP